MRALYFVAVAMLIGIAMCLFDANSIQTNIPAVDLVGWQPCIAWTYSQVGPTLAQVASRCGGEIAIGCKTVGAVTVKVWASVDRDTFLDLNSGLSFPKGTTTFYREENNYVGFHPSSIDPPPSACSQEVSSAAVCWALTNQTLTVGGYCGDFGSIGGPTTEKVIYHSPCRNLTANDPCVEGSSCVTAAHCNATTEQCITDAVIDYSVNNTDCKTFECNEFTGAADVTFKLEFTPCDDGINCTSGDRCDGAGTCLDGFTTACPLSTECSLSLGCIESSGQCEFSPINGSCIPSSTCFESGVCSNHTCTDGTPVTCPTPGADSCRSPLGCNPSTGQCEFALVTSGPCTLPSNNCTLTSACSALAICEEATRDPCTSPPTCQVKIGNGTCTDFFGCTYQNDNGSPCTLTGDVCALEYKCLIGQCIIKDRMTCPGGGVCERPANCDKVTGCPAPVPLPFGTLCQNGDPCLRDSFCNGATSCLPGSALDCSVSLGPCYSTPVCLVGGGCNGTALTGNACNSGDACNPGVCDLGRCLTVDICGTMGNTTSIFSPACIPTSTLFSNTILAIPAA